MKFAAIQTGARRGYAVPLILERAGLLECFYTDLGGNLGIGRFLGKGSCLPVVGPSLNRLASRRIPPELLRKTTGFGWPRVREIFEDAFGSKDTSSRFPRQIRFSERWGRAMIQKGFGDATHVYSMLSEGGPLLAAAQKRGLRVISEVYILLSTERILQEERKAFPGWEPDAPDYGELRRKWVPVDLLMEHTDFFICPSQAVQDDLIRHWGRARERTVVVPYGMNPSWLELEPRPQRGRILFVGTADLRKGIHYLAMAADLLKNQGHNYEFRVAGHVSDDIRRQPMCRHLTFLGRVSRARISEEFQQADVFVLPSLAEGSAEVTYEALASGLPVVATGAAGSVARDGIEGRIIPERDSKVLAEAIEQIVEDRDLRNRLALAARVRANDFTWEYYGERLIDALKHVNI